MKKLFQISLILILSMNVSAQYGPPIEFAPSTPTVQDVFAVDLDGDGHADVLTASYRSSQESNISYYQNLGDGTFGDEIIISSEVDDARSVFAVDMDSDGDMDVLSASFYDDKIAWYENLGSGVFGSQQVISDSADGASTVHAADIDNDGDIDVLSGSELDNKIAWYENLGNGSFGSVQVISTSAAYIDYAQFVDMDNDGDMDVLSASAGWNLLNNKISYFENLGDGIFDNENVLSTVGLHIVDVFCDDMDGDGDLDIIYGEQDPDIGSAYILWKEGLGDGTFGVTHSVGSGAFVGEIYSADLDGDGDLEVISSSYNAIRVHENLGDNNFIAHTISIAPAISFSSADFDNDGDDDLLLGPKTIRKISWYGSLGAEVDGFGTEQIISVSSASGALSVYSSDLDNDGDIDVLSASYIDDKIAWYENLDNDSFAAQQIISTSADGASSVYSSDLDGDGDMDVLSASLFDSKIAWYENLGDGVFGAEQIIGTSGNYTNSMSLHTSDLDGDGDLDVIYTFETTWMNGDKLAWFENLGSGSFGEEQIISGSNAGFWSAFSVDFDNDGDQDILTATIYEIKWFENTGSGIFGPQHIISTDAVGRTIIHCDDLDGDGDLDVISGTASSSNDKVAWYENLGNGSFGPQNIISTSVESVVRINSSDLDGDGDVDVLIACASDDIIGWYENLGDGEFGPLLIISNIADRPWSVTADDLDGDGDMDVLSASTLDDKIAWYENLTPICIPDGSAFSASICGGEEYSFGAQILNQSGEYTITFDNQLGCDSIVTLDLTVQAIPFSESAAIICQGSSFTFNGIVYNQTGLYNQVIPTANECDSIASLDLTVTPILSSTTVQSICDGESFIFNTVSYSTSGEYTYTTSTLDGCDSIAILNLEVFPLPNAEVSFADGILSSSSGAGYQWYLDGEIITGAVNQTFVPLSNGTYNVTVFDTNNCSETSAGYAVILTGIFELQEAQFLSLVPNPNNGSFQLHLDKAVGQLSIFNVLGEIIYEQEILGESIDTDLVPGAYIVMLEQDGRVWSSRLIVQ